MAENKSAISRLWKIFTTTIEVFDSFEDLFLIRALKRFHRKEGQGSARKDDTAFSLLGQPKQTLRWYESLSSSDRAKVALMSKDEREKFFLLSESERNAFLRAVRNKDYEEFKNQIRSFLGSHFVRARGREAAQVFKWGLWLALAGPILAVLFSLAGFLSVSYFLMTLGALGSLPYGLAAVGLVKAGDLILAITPGETIEGARLEARRVMKNYASLLAMEYLMGFMLFIFAPHLTIPKVVFFLYTLTILGLATIIVEKESEFWEWVWWGAAGLSATFLLYAFFSLATDLSGIKPLTAAKYLVGLGWSYGMPVLTAFIFSVISGVMNKRSVISGVMNKRKVWFRRSFGFVALLLWIRAVVNFIPVRYQVRLVGVDTHPYLLLNEEEEDMAWQIELAQGKYKSETCQKEAERMQTEIKKFSPSFKDLSSEEEDFRNEMRGFEERCSPYRSDSSLLYRPFGWLGEKLSPFITRFSNGRELPPPPPRTEKAGEA